MRPIADTAVASIVNIPALDCSSWPQCTRCQSVAQPSTAEYWHIGETTMRLASASLRSLYGVNRAEDISKMGAGCKTASVADFGPGAMAQLTPAVRCPGPDGNESPAFRSY